MPRWKRNTVMKGLECSRRYFEAYGSSLIARLEKEFPALKGQFAAGLVGAGSECLGFDDALSADHDYGPSFCLWLPDVLWERYGENCQEAYDSLPGEFEGVLKRRITPEGGGRIGVLSIERFFFGLIGRTAAPVTNTDWIWIPESRLSQAANGAVFLDQAGRFSAVYDALRGFYPEDVRKKKIAARAAVMAQSGQYNYGRLSARGEWTGAFLALQEFVKNTCSMVHLLNRRYTPFYKWMHRSLKELAVLPQIYGLLDQLTAPFDSRSAWQTAAEEDFLYGVINKKDTRAVLIETICQLVIRELEAQRLSDSHDLYLESHALSVMKQIKDPEIAALSLMEG